MLNLIVVWTSTRKAGLLASPFQLQGHSRMTDTDQLGTHGFLFMFYSMELGNIAWTQKLE